MSHPLSVGMIGTQELLISIREFKRGTAKIEEATSLGDTPGRQLD